MGSRSLPAPARGGALRGRPADAGAGRDSVAARAGPGADAQCSAAVRRCERGRARRDHRDRRRDGIALRPLGRRDPALEDRPPDPGVRVDRAVHARDLVRGARDVARHLLARSGPGSLTMRDDLTSLISELVAIDSVNPSLVEGGAGEGEIASFIARWAAENGLHAELLEETPGR